MDKMTPTSTKPRFTWEPYTFRSSSARANDTKRYRSVPYEYEIRYGQVISDNGQKIDARAVLLYYRDAHGHWLIDSVHDTFSSAASAAEGEDVQPIVNEPQRQFIMGNSANTAERDRLTAELAEATAKITTVEEQALRAVADYANLRRRSAVELAETKEYAAMDIVRELLPVLDGFELAMRHETVDKDYAKGVELVYGGLRGMLRVAGLEQIEATGKSFDPALHQAVARVQSAEFPDQMVVESLQSGYTFKGKLLRPAMVSVTVTPEHAIAVSSSTS
jgi:molecular chaperone GrpE